MKRSDLLRLRDYLEHIELAIEKIRRNTLTSSMARLNT